MLDKMVSTLSVTSVLLSLLLTLTCAEAGDYTIKKSELCPAISKDAFCTDEFDFITVVDELLKATKLSKEKSYGQYGKLSASCAKALKTSVCSSDTSPLCLDDAQDTSDNGPRKVCSDLRENCPLLQGRSFDDYEDKCVAYLRRTFTDLTCKAVSTDAKFKGYCPKPQKKMPASYLKLYELTSKSLEGPMGVLESVNNHVGGKLFSEDCMETIKEMACVQYYCSEDEETVIIPDAEASCNKLMNCITKVHQNSEYLSKKLEPFKKELTNSCDQFVNLVKAQAQKSSGSSPYSQLLLLFVCLFLKLFLG